MLGLSVVFLGMPPIRADRHRPRAAATTRQRGEPATAGRGESGARELLLDAALARFGADGVMATTLEDIRRDAGVSVGALYHHFPDKTTLASALYTERLGDFQDGFLAVLRASDDAEAGVKGGVRFYLRWVAGNRAAAAFLLAWRPEDAALHERNRRFFADAMSWWRTHASYGALRALPFDLIEALWLGPAQEYARHWVAGRARGVPSGVAGELADAAWQTLKEAR
jgi:AcrR family transcriptional regulator